MQGKAVLWAKFFDATPENDGALARAAVNLINLFAKRRDT